MLRSLFAGISGLRVNQVMLDVTGNNIANANTIGFKSSRTVFSDTLSQMLTASTAPGNGRGGTNPIQVGLGVQVAATTTNFNQGSNQTTGGLTDMMIQGDGFFVVRKGGQDVYTRAGAFTFDEQRNLVAPDGGLVLGYTGASIDATGNVINPAGATPTPISLPADDGAAPPAVPSPLKSYEIGADGKITATFDNDDRRVIAQLAIADFNNPAGLEKVGATSFRASANSGAPQTDIPGAGSRGQLVIGSVEMSNVDLAAEFTNLILAQRGFQASSRVITTSDQVLEDLVNIKR
ncbi:flagellar hook-basal body complex protein [Nocardioides sp. LMS-CY]|uniref:Flagellar hook protein FlgE n=1 Tax=Nocardioides soli TaxID=1036020 RepID=A0A7W4VWM3_9ACTN|nr:MULTISPECIES: flagellar hook-basal body complex protein [Nocardioides]MBB3043005.1 flagellar hook protein FlgE [Nocardioides soli]QWF23099.1 flagellar hook-basal body complex protein [Nocardioides sp. LMS-CY]